MLIAPGQNLDKAIHFESKCKSSDRLVIYLSDELRFPIIIHNIANSDTRSTSGSMEIIYLTISYVNSVQNNGAIKSYRISSGETTGLLDQLKSCSTLRECMELVIKNMTLGNAIINDNWIALVIRFFSNCTQYAIFSKP